MYSSLGEVLVGFLVRRVAGAFSSAGAVRNGLDSSFTTLYRSPQVKYGIIPRYGIMGVWY